MPSGAPAAGHALGTPVVLPARFRLRELFPWVGGGHLGTSLLPLTVLTLRCRARGPTAVGKCQVRLQCHGHKSPCDQRASEQEEPRGSAKCRKNILVWQIFEKKFIVL